MCVVFMQPLTDPVGIRQFMCDRYRKIYTALRVALLSGFILISPYRWYGSLSGLLFHGDVIKRKHFPHYWPFVRGIHHSAVGSPRQGQ